MGTTRQAIRQQVGYDLDELLVGTLTLATPTTARVWELADLQRHPQDVQGSWLYVTSGALAGSEVRLGQLEPASGTVTLATPGWRPEGGQPAAGDGFEIHRLLPATTLNRIIRETVQRLGRVVTHELAIPGSQTTSYDLSALEQVSEPSQVLRVRYRRGREAGGFAYRTAKWHRVERDEGGLVLTVRPYYANTQDTVLLDCWEPYDDLATDEAETDCPREWVESAVRVRVYEELMRRGPGESVQHYMGLLADERQRLQRHSYRHGPGVRVRLSMANRGGD